MKKISFKLITILLTLSMVTAFVGCAKAPSPVAASHNQFQTKQDSPSYAKIKKAGQIVLGTSADYPPYEFHKSVNGADTIVGFDIEIAKTIASDLGVKLVIKDMKFDGLLAALDAGNIDFIVAGMNPTAERAKNVDFSNVYYKSTQTLVVRTSDNDKYKTAGDLAGKVIDVQKGTIQEKLAATIFAKSTAKALPKISDLIMSLQNNKADGAIIESPVAKAYVSKNSDITISDITVPSDQVGAAAALKKGSTDLVALVNKTLDKLTSTNAIDKLVGEANLLVEQ